MLVRWFVVALLAILLSGCLSPSVQELDSASTLEDGEARSPVTTNVLSFEYSGDAGDWALVWAPFSHNKNPYQMVGTEHFETEATDDVSMAFVAPLDLVLIAKNHTHWGGGGSRSMGVEVSDSVITHGLTHRNTVHARNVSGLFAFYSASVPWTVSINITLEDALLVEPRIETGTGASFEYGGVQKEGMRLPVGEVELKMETVERGWTHIEFLSERLQPQSDREIDIGFADGFQVSGESSTSGFCLITTCGAGDDGHGDQFGSINNTVGENWGRATYQEAGYGVDVAIVHLPGAHKSFPAEFNTTHYERASWPFTGFGTPPP